MIKIPTFFIKWRIQIDEGLFYLAKRLHLIKPFSSLLSSHQVKVVSRCANGLNHILPYLSLKNDGVISETLKETNAVIHIINNIQKFSRGMESIKYFQRIASLLSRILWRWLPSRYRVWNDAKLLRVLEVIRANSDSSVKVAVLQLYSALGINFFVPVF